MTRIILFNKPFNVLSQFTDRAGRATLADYIEHKGVYPIGRLDRDSEGLLALTDDGALKHKLAHPDSKVSKCYWAQVEGTIDDEALAQLAAGVELKDGMTLPCKAQTMDPPALWERSPPVRFRKSIPTSWLQLTLTEGRNRQVRRMCAAVGYPVLRLIRYRIASWTIDGLDSGAVRVIQDTTDPLSRA